MHAVQAFDLLSSLLRYDHNERATAAEALAHEYFTPVRCVYVRVLLPVSGAAVADAVHDLLPFVPSGKSILCFAGRGGGGMPATVLQPPTIMVSPLARSGTCWQHPPLPLTGTSPHCVLSSDSGTCWLPPLMGISPRPPAWARLLPLHWLDPPQGLRDNKSVGSTSQPLVR